MYQMLLYLLIALLPTVSSQPPVAVRTPRGTVIGFHANLNTSPTSLYYGEADVFLGIPYAVPPIGSRRFKKPQPVFSYGTTALNASKYKDVCPQFNAGFAINEDCLYLNVITPTILPHTLYPVMVFIHGGSLNSGSSHTLPYEGAIRNLVSHGVVVVNIQYRLGLLGFFTTHTDDFPANLGMLDQVEALKWVQSEIRYFGGDPSRVTIFGQSAGAASVSAHTYSPLSKGLFSAAILQSGSILTCFDGTFGFSNMSQQLAEKLCNVTTTEWKSGQYSRLHECLMNLDYMNWMDFEKTNLRGWTMSQDNYFMPNIPRHLASLRRNVPIMIGSMKDEFASFLMALTALLGNNIVMDRNFFITVLKSAASIPDHQLVMLEALLEREYLPGGGQILQNSTVWMKAISDALTAGTFIVPMQKDIREWIGNGNDRVYIYEMNHPSTVINIPTIGSWSPAVHSGDMPYITADPLQWNAAINNGTVKSIDIEILNWMGQTWTNFAKTGSPGGPWSPVPRHSTDLPYLSMSSIGIFMQPSYRRHDEFVWNNLVPQIIGDLPRSTHF